MLMPFFLAAATLVPLAGDSLVDDIKKFQKLQKEGGASLEKALEIIAAVKREATRREDIDLTLWARWKEGECHALRGEYPRARRLLERAAVMAPKDHGLLVYIHRDLAEACMRSWDHDKARRYLELAIRRAEEQKKKPLRVGKHSIEITRPELLRMKLLGTQCKLYTGGDLTDARKDLQALGKEIMALHEAGKLRGGEWEFLPAEVSGQLAEFHRRGHDTIGSIGHLSRCLDLVKPCKFSPGRAIDIQFSCRLTLAVNYRNLARFREAEAELKEADRLCTRSPTVRNKADLSNAWASLWCDELTPLLDSEGLTARVSRLLQRAEKAIATARGEEDLKAFAAADLGVRARILDLHGRILAQGGKNKEADEKFAKAVLRYSDAVRMFEAIPGPTHDLTLQTRRLRAWANVRRGKFAEARDEAAEITRLFARTHGEDSPDLGDFHHLMLEIEARAGKPADAAPHAERNRKLSARSLTPYLTRLAAPEQLGFFRASDDPALHSSLRLGVQGKGLGDASAEWLANGKAKIAEATAMIHLQTRGERAEKELHECIRRQSTILYGRPDMEEAARLESLLEQERKKRGLVAKRGAGLPKDWHSLDKVKNALHPDEAYVDVFSLRPAPDSPRAYFAWVTRKGKPTRVVKLGEQDKIDRLVGAFTRHMANCPEPGGAFEKAGPRAAEQGLRRDCLEPLSRSILDPITKAVGDCTRWTVSPDGLLWNIPWGALVLPRDGPYAVEKITFRYVLSGRDLVRKPFPAAEGDPWILGDPDLDQSPPGTGWRRRPAGDPFRMERLPGASEEGREVAEALRKLFKGRAIPQMAGTTKNALMKLSGPRIVYLATHAYSPLPAGSLPVDDPLLACGIFFAGMNWVPGKDGGTLPGLLTGAEIALADLHGTELVVLSACRSGFGEVKYGQSPADLRHAFHLAGARGVVSTLWSIDDEDAKLLMVPFVESFAKDGRVDKADRLNEAQRERIKALRAGDGRNAHPFKWAAFTFSGS